MKSLYHLSIEYVEKYFNVNEKYFEEEDLPKQIKDLLRNRSRKNNLVIQRPLIDGEQVFTRSVLHAGL